MCDSSKENYFPTNIFLIDQHDVLYVVYSIFVNKVKTHLEVRTMIRNICSTTQRREREIVKWHRIPKCHLSISIRYLRRCRLLSQYLSFIFAKKMLKIYHCMDMFDFCCFLVYYLYLLPEPDVNT